MPQPTRSAARVEAKLLPAYLPKSYLSVASTRDIYVIGTPLQTEKTQHLGTGLCAVLPLCSIWAAHATWTDSFASFFQLDQARVNCGGCRLIADNQSLGSSRALQGFSVRNDQADPITVPWEQLWFPAVL